MIVQAHMVALYTCLIYAVLFFCGIIKSNTHVKEIISENINAKRKTKRTIFAEYFMFLFFPPFFYVQRNLC